MRRVSLFLLFALVVVGGVADAATTMMASNAPVHISWVALPPQASSPEFRYVTVTFAVGDRQEAGTHHGTLTATFTRVDESKPFWTNETSITFVVEPSAASQGTILKEVSLEQQMPIGRGFVNLTLRADAETGGGVWGTYESGEFEITGPRGLGREDGFVQEYSVSSIDFDAYLGTDLWLTTIGSTEPPTADFSLRTYPWKTTTFEGHTFTGSVGSTSAVGTHEIRIARSAVQRIFLANPANLAINVMDGAEWRWDSNGDFVVTYEPSAPAATTTSSAPTMSPPPPPPPRSADVFFDLTLKRAVAPTEPLPRNERVAINVSDWDVDEQGARDVFFFDSDATNRSDAENTSPDERRAEPVQLGVQLFTNATDGGREVEFVITRVSDPPQRGAWIEFRDATALLRRLLVLDDTEQTPSPNVTLHMGADEGFVEVQQPSTWVWIGHFSTQRLTFWVPAEDADPPASSSTVPPRKTVEFDRIPSASVLVVAVALATSGLVVRRMS